MDETKAGNWRAPFFTIWGGQQLSLIGSRVAMFALIWWLTKETGSATVLALATLFAMLPQIVVGPLAGVYVDRWNRRTVMIVADGVIALVSLWLAYLFWSGRIEVWHVYVIMLAREMGGIFHWPAMQSSTSLMVPREHLARVSGINQAMGGALSIVGPVLGAVLLDLAAIHTIMLMDVVTAAFAIAPLFVIAIPQPERAVADGAPVSIWGDLRAGFHYLMGLRGLVYLTALAMVFKIALTPAFSLLPLFVTDHLDGGASQLAGLEMMFGIGVILGGLFLGVWGGFKRDIVTSTMGIVLVGVWTLLLGLIPAGAFPLAVALLFAIGVSVSFSDGPIMAVMQKTIAPEMQGRVFMLFVSLLGTTSPIGLAIAGPVTDAVGIQVWYVVAGVLCAGAGLIALMIPSVVHLEDLAPSASAPAEEAVPAQMAQA